MLRREDITKERIDAWIAEGRRHGYDYFLSPAKREALRRRALARLRRGDDLWMFGYGSLMWAPAFHFVERRPATLHGWHRRFCFWTPLGRGTPKLPGLMLALERGGMCRGVAFRIAARQVQSETTIVWMREMVSGVYRPQWVDIDIGRRRVTAVTFVINRDHPLYCGRLSLDRAAHHIAFAEGRNGPCRDYLAHTITQLQAMRITDREMSELWRRVQHLRAGGPAVAPAGLVGG